jgi:hypothetical protein
MKKLFLSFLVLGLFTACSDKSGGEPKAEAAVSVDFDEAKASAKKTLKNAEREIEKGAAKAKDKLEDAGEAISDKLAEAKDKLTDDDKASIKVEVKKD